MTETEHKHNFQDLLSTAQILVRFYCRDCDKWIEEIVPDNYTDVSNKVKELLDNADQSKR